jgi:plastocyanin
MMNRGVLIGIVASLAVLAASGVITVAMMVAMAGGHMGMFGGRGSDPADETPVAGITEVRIEDFAFSPANIVVAPGTTVTWTNEDRAGHTVTSDGGDELDSELLRGGDSYRHTFETRGAFAYHCRPHPYMKGLVTVR